MINWLVDQQFIFSMSIALILICNHFLVKPLGAKLSYALWLFIPAMLIANNLPIQASIVAESQVTRFAVTLSNQVNQSVQIDGIFWTWALGSALMAAYVLFEHKRFIQNLGTLHAQKHSPYARLPIFTNNAIASPILVGLLNPKLLLPNAFSNRYDHPQQTLILEHEYTHFARKDNWANALAIGLVVLFWFNPLAWLGYAQFRRMQEVSCDAIVLEKASTEEKLTYCKAMLKTALNTRYGLYSYSHYSEKKTMKQRMQHIKTLSKGNALVKLLVSATLVVGLSSIAFAAYVEPLQNKEAKHNNDIRAVKRIEPRYPIEAARNNIEGSVVLKFDIAPSGAVKNVNVVASEPENTFNKAAKIAVEQWVYSASPTGMQDALVQLDFALTSDYQPKALVESIKVKKH